MPFLHLLVQKTSDYSEDDTVTHSGSNWESLVHELWHNYASSSEGCGGYSQTASTEEKQVGTKIQTEVAIKATSTEWGQQAPNATKTNKQQENDYQGEWGAISSEGRRKDRGVSTPVTVLGGYLDAKARVWSIVSLAVYNAKVTRRNKTWISIYLMAFVKLLIKWCAQYCARFWVWNSERKKCASCPPWAYSVESKYCL